MNVYKWSVTAASNNSAVPDGAPDAWTGADVNNWGRETMAAVRAMYEDSTYIEITYQLASVGAKSLNRVSATRIDVLACDATAYFTADRRIKIVGDTTDYGVVVSSTFSTDTQVTVTMEDADVPTTPTAIFVHVDPTIRNSAFKEAGSGNGLDADTVDAVEAATIAGRGVIGGLKLSNAADATNDIATAAGTAVDSTFAIVLNLASATTKRADATWAAGTGNGGMASGLTFSSGTNYHVFLLGSTNSATPDVGFDTSLTAANLLADAAVVTAGHTKYARIGSLRTGGSAAWPVFTQVGDQFILSVPVLDVDTSSLGTSAALQTLSSIPPGIRIEALVNVYMENNAAAIVYLSSPDASDQAPSATAAPLGGFLLIENTGFGDDFIATQQYLRIRTNTSQQIRARSSASSTTLRIATLGWSDARGKDA